MQPLLWLACVFVLFVLSYWRRLLQAFREHRRFIELIDKVPGPSAIPILGSALKFSPDNEKATYQMEYYFRKHTENPDSPGLMRIWLGPKPLLILYKAESAKVVLESHALISKPSEYRFLADWLDEGLLTSTGEKWHTRRKLITPTFHFSILGNYLNVFNRQSRTFISSLDEHADDGYPFDFYPLIKSLAFDVICESAMGIEMGIQKGNNPEYVLTSRKLSELTWMRMRSPWLWPKWAWYLSGREFEFDRCLKVVRSFCARVIRERKEDRRVRASTTSTTKEEGGGRKRLAFLDLLLDAQEEDRLSDEDIREEVDTFLLAGHDTISTTAGFTTFMLGMFPHIQDKIYAEMKEIFEGEGAMEGDITVEEIGRMHYLDMCIKESMRLLPSVPMIGRVLNQETEICGFTIPAGVTAMIAPFAVQRDSRYYHNPDAYDPEHFSPENVKKRDSFAFIPFSAGPRNCIGQKFAHLELRVVLAKIFRRYRVITHMHELENRGLPELNLKPSKGFIIRVERR